MHEKKNQKLSEVAVGGGGSQNFRPSLKFYAFFFLTFPLAKGGTWQFHNGKRGDIMCWPVPYFHLFLSQTANFAFRNGLSHFGDISTMCAHLHHVLFHRRLDSLCFLPVTYHSSCALIPGIASSESVNLHLLLDTGYDF